MNFVHLKYAVEVEKTRSITKAADNLFMSQPNLSRAIKELEETLGITIFRRTSKGIVPTEQGEEFLSYAKNILAQVREMESIYKRDAKRVQELSVSVPRASYVTDAFTRFVSSLDRTKEIEIRFCETNSMNTVDHVLQDDYHLGVARCRAEFEAYFPVSSGKKSSGMNWYRILKGLSYCRRQTRLRIRRCFPVRILSDVLKLRMGILPFPPFLRRR